MNPETKVIGIIAIITIIVIGGGLFLASGKISPGQAPTALSAEALVRADSPRQTGSQAVLQIVEFADFECPACAAFHPHFKRFKQEYADKIDFVFRVIPIHRNSKAAAAVAYAAGEQGKFFEMHDVLFEKQDEWTKVGANIDTLFTGYAQGIGLDMAKYQSDLAANKNAYSARVDQDGRDAGMMNLNSTPTLVFNGKTVVRGGLTYENLKKLADAEIAAALGTAATSTATSSAN